MTELVVHGCPPEPRSFHTVTAVGDRVVVAGGRGTSDQHFQDFHIFDTSRLFLSASNLFLSCLFFRGVYVS